MGYSGPHRREALQKPVPRAGMGFLFLRTEVDSLSDPCNSSMDGSKGEKKEPN
jgi:hypothetical protein